VSAGLERKSFTWSRLLNYPGLVIQSGADAGTETGAGYELAQTGRGLSTWKTEGDRRKRFLCILRVIGRIMDYAQDVTSA